jgi:hypothetical protein
LQRSPGNDCRRSAPPPGRRQPPTSINILCHISIYK